MKELLSNLIKGRDNRISGLFAFSIVALIALGCTCGKDLNLGESSNTSGNSVFSEKESEEIDRNLINATIKSTTAQFAGAISTEDFSNLYAGTADEFKKQYSEEELKNTFKDFIRQKRQLLPILAKTVSMDPDFSSEPSTHKEGNEEILTAEGKYDTKPVPVTFKYEYVKRGATWKLLRMEIYVK